MRRRLLRDQLDNQWDAAQLSEQKLQMTVVGLDVLGDIEEQLAVTDVHTAYEAAGIITQLIRCLDARDEPFPRV
jgi:hypothetical protein